jgi:hypothetical protein
LLYHEQGLYVSLNDKIMQTIRFKWKGLMTANHPASTWIFSQQSIQSFIQKNALVFESLSRLSMPHGGSVIQ